MFEVQTAYRIRRSIAELIVQIALKLMRRFESKSNVNDLFNNSRIWILKVTQKKKTTPYVRLKFVILLVLRAKAVSLSCMTMTANQFHIKTDEEKTIHDFLCFYAIRFGNSVEFKLKQHIRTLSRIDVTVFASRTECNRINICWLS